MRLHILRSLTSWDFVPFQPAIQFGCLSVGLQELSTCFCGAERGTNY
jgi:hypothetical protein